MDDLTRLRAYRQTIGSYGGRLLTTLWERKIPLMASRHVEIAGPRARLILLYSCKPESGRTQALFLREASVLEVAPARGTCFELLRGIQDGDARRVLAHLKGLALPMQAGSSEATLKI